MGGVESYSASAGGDASIDVDQIKFGKKLGSGSFGAVWKATWLDRTVAVKQFFNVDQRTYDREVAQLSGLSHPNIIKVFGAGWRGEDLFLVMEFAVDGSLYDTLHKPGQAKTAIPQAISWGLQCAKGVAYLHSQSVVHRDLKPHNSLLFNGKAVLKICDFGTARDVVLSERRGPGGLSQSMTQSVGTPLYTAPEVYLGRDYSEKCDVYSWAIMMWEILTCKMPYADFGIDSIEELKQIKKSGKTPAPVRGLPDRLDSVIKSAWAVDPSDRPTMARVVQIMGAI